VGDDGLARLSGRERLLGVLPDDPAGDRRVEPVRQEERQLDELLRLAVLLSDDDVL